jgi:predicted transcriptional regulator
MPRKPRFTVEQIEHALRESAGLQYVAANLLRCAPSTVTSYVQSSKRLQRVIEECQQGVLDLAEGKIVEKIRDGDLTAIIFYLKTKGKNRGYTERQEHSGPDGKDLPHVIVAPQLSENPDAWQSRFKPKAVADNILPFGSPNPDPKKPS